MDQLEVPDSEIKAVCRILFRQIANQRREDREAFFKRFDTLDSSIAELTKLLRQQNGRVDRLEQWKEREEGRHEAQTPGQIPWGKIVIGLVAALTALTGVIATLLGIQ